MNTTTKKRCMECNRLFESEQSANICEDCIADLSIDDEVQDEPDYWACGCGYTCVRKPGWGQCPRCTAIMEPEYY